MCVQLPPFWRPAPFAVALLHCTLIGCSQSPNAPSDRGPLPIDSQIAASQRSVDFGVLEQGSLHNVYIDLTNTGIKACRVENIRTSCDCLEVQLARSYLEPGEHSICCLKLDLNVEPDFIGRLAIEVDGLGPSGESLFALIVKVDVRTLHEFAVFSSGAQ